MDFSQFSVNAKKKKKSVEHGFTDYSKDLFRHSFFRSLRKYTSVPKVDTSTNVIIFCIIIFLHRYSALVSELFVS